MSVTGEPRLDSAQLGQLLESVEPAALLVPPRLLRRIIKYDRNLTELGLQVPHRKSYVIGREELLALAGRGELGVQHDRELPPTLILLYRSDDEALAAAPREQTLLKYWRLLFHARIHQALSDRFKAMGVTHAAIRQRIHRIGQTEFAEARTVLRLEKYLLPPHDDCAVYEEFAAFYLEMSFFAAPLLPATFPPLATSAWIDQILAEDVDAAALFAATRLAGAPDPVCLVDNPNSGDEPAPATFTTPMEPGSDKQYQDLVSRADRAAAAGNAVRAAIFRTQAARVAPFDQVTGAQDRAARRSGPPVPEAATSGCTLRAAEADAWRRVLPALLPHAAEGIWPVEARLLYDIQKICVDHERPTYAPDVVEWAYSHFRQPFLRPLPNQPLVLAVKHLRIAVGRLPAVRVAEPERQALSGLLRDALGQAASRLRECFRPCIRDALERVGLRPQNFPERLGEAKLIEELLDRITERGFLNMSDLRDALARNQLKLPDLSGPREFFQGDPLIRLNRELAVTAAGVYHRGEIYLRWLQRGSALAFGTRPGQWFVLFLALPFLGAFATVVFADEMRHICVWLLRLFQPVVQGATEPSGTHKHLDLARYAMPTVVLGIFYLLLVHWPSFRRMVMLALHFSWQAIRLVFIEAPAAFLRLPALHWFLHSRPFLLLVRFAVKPLPVAVLAWFTLEWFGTEPETANWGAGIAFLAGAVLLNTRVGRDLEEALIDRIMRNWEHLQGLLPGLFRLLVNIFKSILEAVDRFLYTVDEWLRFRAGEGRLTLAAKTVLGFLWSLVTYVVRLYVNVFLEPTFNPIKHFPVVTVVAKFLVPLWGVLLGLPKADRTGILCDPFLFMGLWPAYIIGFIILHSIPGAAGFLVWEFKENWRLYRTNRPVTLRPEIIGHHGETMLRLMKPGFHSGTLPKLYAKLRRAERRAYRGGTWKTARRLRETLHHVEARVRHFTERELLAFLEASRGWTAGRVHLVAVEAGSNRIRLQLACSFAENLSLEHAGERQESPHAEESAHLGKGTLELHFEEQAGWLIAHVHRAGWLARLADDQLAVFTTALLGFYHKAGVDLVREQMEACFVPTCPPYDIGGEGLIVWPGQGYDTEVIYNLGEEPVLHPRLKDGQPPAGLPSPTADELIFKRQPITWNAWVAAWELDQAGKGNPQKMLPQVRVLPIVQ